MATQQYAIESDLLIALHYRVLSQMGVNYYISDTGTTIINEEDFIRLCDVGRYGASGGVSGFIYYSETTKFFDDNEDEITDFADEQAKEIGEKNMFTMAGNFNNPPDNMTSFKNIMAWFALEETARLFLEYAQPTNQQQL